MRPPPSPWLRLGAIAGVFAVMFVLEEKYPLRRPSESKWRRLPVNLAIGLISGAILHFVCNPLVARLAARVRQSGMGLLPQARLPAGIETAAAVLLLDWSFYFWHVILHRVRGLWPYHYVHHMDRDLDTTTTFRFHFIEMMISSVFRGGQVLLIGPTPRQVALFEALVLCFGQFHHSNTRLPLQIERWLGFVIMTPRMHGIHHSVVRSERDSNLGTIFNFWDRLHGTFRMDIPQKQITIGMAGSKGVIPQRGFLYSLAAPFTPVPY